MEIVMRRLGSLAVLLLFLVSPGGSALAAKVSVFVSIPPQKYFVQKIGGDRVAVAVLAGPGSNPHNYEPKPRQMAELAGAAVYFAVGLDFERAWLPRIAAASPGLLIVRTDEGIAKIAMAGHRHDEPEKESARGGKKNAPGHAGEAGPDRPEGAPDPHVWLAPALVKIQARHILQALAAADAGGRERYEANFAAFLREIDALDDELKALFVDRQAARFLVLHPSWGYFAQAYGLEQVPIEFEGKDPKPAQLGELIRFARGRGIKAVFVQPQFSAKSAELVAREIGGRVVVADPLAENWAGNLRAVAGEFAAALR
jgi:zinc transport system substrate-binding protein